MTDELATLGNASPGDKFVYAHPDSKGYGEEALGQSLTAEMTELDLKQGMEVTLLEYDADSGQPLVQWVDDTGINRITTVHEDYIINFAPVG